MIAPGATVFVGDRPACVLAACAVALVVLLVVTA